MLDKKNFYINGQWVSPIEPRNYKVIDPSSEEPCAEISLGGKKDVDKAVSAAKKAFETWAFTKKEERLELLEKLYVIYKKRWAEMAKLISLEMGAPIKFSTEMQAATGAGHIKSFKQILKDFKFEKDLGEGKKLQSILILGKAMEKYSKALELNIDLKPQIIALQYLAGIQLIEIADQVDEFDEIILAIQSLEQAKGISSGIGTNNEKLLKDLKNKLKKLDNYKTGMIIDHKMSEARYLQAIARSPRLTIGMTLPLIEDLLGAPHEKIISEKNAKEEQLWIYYLNEKQLQLSFKDFILFKIEEL